MNITMKGSVDAGKLNEELAAALGDWCEGWTPRHNNGTEAIVILLPEREKDEQLVRDTIAAHIAAAPAREAAKPFDAEILRLEQSVTEKMYRDAALGNSVALKAISDAIAAQEALKIIAIQALD
jgi:hypothetical protein